MYTGIIYKYTSPSNKVYVGQTINEYNRKNAFKNIKHLYAGGKIDKARLKYGPDNFQYEVLETIEKDSKKELLETLNNLEVQYITKYDSFKSGNAAKSVGLTSTTSITQSCSSGSCSKGYFWRYYTENYPKNIDVKVSKHCLATIKHKNIYQYTLDKHLVNTYHSYKEAAESVNANSSGISLCCRGLQKTYKGYLWEEDYDIG